MNLTDHLIRYIESEARKKGWINPNTNEVSIADLSRNSDFSEATWSRIMRKKQKTIKDDVAAAIGDMFGASPMEMLLISIGEHPAPKNLAHINETSPDYNTNPIFTHEQEDKLRKLADRAGLSFEEFLRRRADAIIEAAREIYPDL